MVSHAPMASASAGKQSRKRRRRRRRHASAGAAAVGPDRFTHLHDDLLSCIVHRLPVRSAASLAGVSRHFRAQVPAILDRVDSLTLYEPHFPTPLPDGRPVLLRRLAIAPHAAIPPSKFRPILRTVAGHGLTELCIRLPRRARLPRNVFSIRSLAVLTLDNCAVPRWSDIACPCLRTLKLNRVAVHQKTINQIFASASCLETLEMIYCTGTGGGCTVESSSLKNLVFRPPLVQSEATIRAPGLRTVTLYTRAKAKRLELAPAPEVRKAYLHICKPLRPMDSFRVRSFLDAATSLNCLTLRGLAMKLLSSEYNDTPNMKTVFQNMRILSVSLDLSREKEPVFLLKLLESCPNLQRLTISDVNTNEVKAAETIEDKAPATEDMTAETEEGMDAETDKGMDAETNEGMDAETDKGMDAETNEGMDAETDKGMNAETGEGMDAGSDEDGTIPCFTDHKERLTKISCLTTSLAELRFLGFKPEDYEKSLVVFLLTQAKNLKKVGVQFETNQEAVVKEILSIRKAPLQRTYQKYTYLYVELDYS